MRVARSTLLADVLRPGLVLVFNGTKHPIVLPTFDERTLPLRRELGALRNEMDKLQELKNVADTAAEKVRAVTATAHGMRGPAEANGRAVLLPVRWIARAQHASRLMWGGFFGLCAQWGLMMRLTWYEYSWDVMEPIAYFISFGTRANTRRGCGATRPLSPGAARLRWCARRRQARASWATCSTW